MSPILPGWDTSTLKLIESANGLICEGCCRCPKLCSADSDDYIIVYVVGCGSDTYDNKYFILWYESNTAARCLNFYAWSNGTGD